MDELIFQRIGKSRQEIFDLMNILKAFWYSTGMKTLLRIAISMVLTYGLLNLAAHL
jgi:hypothetical protein